MKNTTNLSLGKKYNKVISNTEKEKSVITISLYTVTKMTKCTAVPTDADDDDDDDDDNYEDDDDEDDDDKYHNDGRRQQ